MWQQRTIPADFVSRGMDSLKLKTCELWWNGPKFLMSNQYPQRQIPFAVIKDPGRSITSIVEPDLTNLNENRLDNWQKITKIIQLIWKRWSVDYLNSLQQRNKWHFEKKNAKIGDMVIIKEDNLPSCQWSLGRINNIYPGKDSKSDEQDASRVWRFISAIISFRLAGGRGWVARWVWVAAWVAGRCTGRCIGRGTGRGTGRCTGCSSVSGRSWLAGREGRSGSSPVRRKGRTGRSSDSGREGSSSDSGRYTSLGGL
ncbi:DUF5641 domain-containing protein [Trichonephila clavipes]|nr:DUF5641 domain-containing protein [Trichonephila clavipes]